MTRRKRAITITATILAACGGTEPVAPRKPLPPDVSQIPASLQLSDSATTMWVSGRHRIDAIFRNAAGRQVAPEPIQWSSDNTSIATVDQAGVVAGIAAGQATVTATAGSLQARVSVHVRNVASLALVAPDTLLILQSDALGIVARDSTGTAISDAPRPVYTSSDSLVVSIHASISGGDSVYALTRGTATISARIGEVVATRVVRVDRLFVLADLEASRRMNVGDTIRLTAIYADVHGAPLPEQPTVRWRSNFPAVVPVTADGLVTGTRAAIARIYAETDEDTTYTDMLVDDQQPGQPTGIRFAHAATGIGPLTFLPSVGDPVTLNYGESLDRPVPPGFYTIRISGSTVRPAGIERDSVHIADGDHLAIYAVGLDSTTVWMTRTWSRPRAVPPGWGAVTIVQGSWFSTYFLRPRGAAVTGRPESCYFDPGDGGDFYNSVMPGGMDILVTSKYGLTWPGHPDLIARIPLDPVPGRSLTAVLVGRSASSAAVLTFIDP